MENGNNKNTTEGNTAVRNAGSVLTKNAESGAEGVETIRQVQELRQELSSERPDAQVGGMPENESMKESIMTDGSQKAEDAERKAEMERSCYGFTTMSAQDVQNGEFPKKDYLVEGLITKGMNLLSGPMKQGKSLLVLNLAIAVAGDTDFLGLPTEHGRVLHMALEDSPKRIKKRLNLILDDKDAPEDLEFTYTVNNITGRAFINRLRQYMEDHPDTKLIIIDVLQKVRGDKRDNQTEYAHDYRDIGGLKEVADEYDTAILAVTHTRKTRDKNNWLNDVAGGVGVTGAADTVLRLERNKKDARIFSKSRDLPDVEMEARLNVDNLRWEYIRTVEEPDINNEEREYDSSPVVRTVRLLLEKNNGEWQGTSRDLLQCGSRELGENIAANEAALGRKLNKFDSFFKKDSILHIKPNSNGGTAGRIHIFKKDDKDMQDKTVEDRNGAGCATMPETRTEISEDGSFTGMNQGEWTDVQEGDGNPFECHEKPGHNPADGPFRE